MQNFEHFTRNHIIDKGLRLFDEKGQEKTLMKVRFFNRIKHLNVKLKCNESADKIRKKTQEMQHMY